MSIPPITPPLLHIPTTEAQRLKEDTGEVRMTLAAAYGVGGSLWEVLNASGGDTGPAAEAVVGIITAFIVNVQQLALTTTASQAAVEANQWQLVAPGQPQVRINETYTRNVEEGDVLRSVLNPALRFTITALQFDGVHSSGLVA